MPAVSRIRKTKIIATIGPASDSPEMLRKMVAAGMNVARLNLSHGTFDEHAERVRRIRQAAEAAGRRLAVMIDTRGSEIRTGRLRNNYADLRRGAEFVLRTDGEPGDEHGVAVTYSKLPREVAGGDVGENVYTYRDMIPVPLQSRGRAHCALKIGDAGVIRVSGSSSTSPSGCGRQ